jgi:hypothetical protein
MHPKAEDFMDRAVETTNSIAGLLSHKRAKYGDRNFDKHGLRGILIRMDDKMSRLYTIMGSQDEGIDIAPALEELQDIAGYAIAAIMRIEGTWKDADV